MNDQAGRTVLREGEVRYESGTIPTDYTYTGQYSNVEDFGLMFYNARWYDVSLGRFAQADTLIPGAGNSQAWDRYAYANNNPLKYNDPSGHYFVCGAFGEGCGSGGGQDDSPNEPLKKNKHDDPALKISSKKEPLCEYLPIICKGGDKNPINYDTITLFANLDIKPIFGVEIRPYIMIDGNAIRNLDTDNFKAALGISASGTVGLSADGAIGLGIMGSQGSILENQGVQQPSWNLGGGLVLHYSYGRGINLISSEQTSVSHTVGAGVGVDASVDVITINDVIVYGDQSTNKGVWRIPFTSYFSVFELPEIQR